MIVFSTVFYKNEYKNERFLLGSALLFLALLFLTLPAFAQNTAPLKQTSPPQDLSEVPDEYLDEAQQFFIYCESRNNLRDYHDCECLASNFLGKRIDMGAAADRTHIMMAIQKTCREASGAAGAEYNGCMGSTRSIPAKVNAHTFCECYARTYATLFEKAGSSVSSKTITRLRTRSRVSCLNPSLGKKLYPTTR